MMKFTKEEISLCGQVAEKHRKPIKYGDWYEFRGNIYLITVKHEPEMHDVSISLWTISDCLEFLREKKEVIELWRAGRGSNWICRIKSQKWWKGKTPLEACLRAVLAVLEEE